MSLHHGVIHFSDMDLLGSSDMVWVSVGECGVGVVAVVLFFIRTEK